MCNDVMTPVSLLLLQPVYNGDTRRKRNIVNSCEPRDVCNYHNSHLRHFSRDNLSFYDILNVQTGLRAEE